MANTIMSKVDDIVETVSSYDRELERLECEIGQVSKRLKTLDRDHRRNIKKNKEQFLKMDKEMLSHVNDLTLRISDIEEKIYDNQTDISTIKKHIKYLRKCQTFNYILFIVMALLILVVTTAIK